MRVAIMSEYPGYVISDDGRIQGRRGWWLKFDVDSHGYARTLLYDGTGKSIRPLVHSLVCAAFHGPKPSPAHEVRHVDGDRSNNRAENLCWGTRAENMADAMRHGTTNRGDRSPNAKLTWEAVEDIRETWGTGTVSQSDLADKYGVSQSVISEVASGKTWRRSE